MCDRASRSGINSNVEGLPLSTSNAQSEKMYFGLDQINIAALLRAIITKQGYLVI